MRQVEELESDTSLMSSGRDKRCTVWLRLLMCGPTPRMPLWRLRWSSVPMSRFVEINLLDMGSNELAQLLRERAQLSHLRLIAMTSSCRHGGRDIVRNAGFERYLLKPAAAADLSRLLAAQPRGGSTPQG
jgi:hypothetical protein